MRKEIIRSVVFILVVACMFIVLCDLFEQENYHNYDQRLYTYRTFPEDTIDATYIGTSGVDRYWIAAKAYEEYGMTVYPLSVEHMPVWLYISLIEEALTYQSPELLLLDVRPFMQDLEVEEMENASRKVLDGMELFSVNRLKTAFRTMKMINKADGGKSGFDISLFLSFVKYHSAIMEEQYRFADNIGTLEHPYGGYNMVEELTAWSKTVKPYVYESELDSELDFFSKEMLYELLDYIEEKNLNVLFVDTPQIRSKIEAGRTDTVYKILEERGFKYLTYYADGALGGIDFDFDYKKDFYGEGHVNYYGAEKFTAAMAAYLDENYDFPDRRNDEKVKQYWDGVYDRIKETVKVYEEKMANN